MNASRKWFQLFLDILDKEVEDGPLLTEGAHRLVGKFPLLGRLAILSSGAIITLHLADLLDERYDLMARNFWKRTANGLQG